MLASHHNTGYKKIRRHNISHVFHHAYFLTEKTAEEPSVQGVWNSHNSSLIRVGSRPVKTVRVRSAQDSTALPDFACIVDKRLVYHHIAFNKN